MAESVVQLENQSFPDKSSLPRLIEKGSRLFERSVKVGIPHFQSMSLKRLVSSIDSVQGDPSLENAQKCIQALDQWTVSNPSEWNTRGKFSSILRSELVRTFGVSSFFKDATVDNIVNFSKKYNQNPSVENKKKLASALLSWVVEIELNGDRLMQLTQEDSYIKMLKSDVKTYLTSLKEQYQRLNLQLESDTRVVPQTFSDLKIPAFMARLTC